MKLMLFNTKDHLTLLLIKIQSSVEGMTIGDSLLKMEGIELMIPVYSHNN